MNQYYGIKNNYPLLSRSKEKSLARKVKKGNISAREELILSNRYLVINIAKRYNADLEDLIQEGSIGLITAIDTFNLDFNCKLSTYATWSIKKFILKYINDKKSFGFNKYYQKMTKDTFDAIEEYVKSEGEEPNIKQLHFILKNKYKNIDSEDIIKILNPCKIFSYDAKILNPLGFDDDLKLINILKDNSVDFREPITDNDFLYRVDYHLKNSGISELGYTVLRQHLIEDKSLLKISKNLNIKPLKIRNTYYNNLKVFKDYLIRNNLISKLF